jgi:uncharacterized protein involved in response to NO
MEISEPKPGADLHPLWQLAFRPGFLLAAAFAVLAMGRWWYWMESPGSWHKSLSPYWWHAHEMVFGFALPVVAGFLLTAVATWTGIAGTRGRALQALFGLWLLARLVLWLTPDWWALAWAAEIGFLAIVLWELTRRVWARRQWRNMLFPPILLVMAGLDTASYLGLDNPLAATRLHYAMVWMISLLIVIVGGRVTPLFTGNRLGLKIAPVNPRLEHLAIASVFLVAMQSVLLPNEHARPVITGLYLFTGAIHLYRLYCWQGWKTRSEPLLWSMHLSYLCIPLALFGLAWAGTDPIASKNLMHLLAIGSIGGMILAMMTRVSLGHTGRPLEVPPHIAMAFALVFCAAVVRALLPLFSVSLTPWAWRVSALLWLVAFAAFLLYYIPVLSSPRPDGKPG